MGACVFISDFEVNIILKSWNDGSVDGRVERTQRPARSPGARQAFPEGFGRESDGETG